MGEQQDRLQARSTGAAIANDMILTLWRIADDCNIGGGETRCFESRGHRFGGGGDVAVGILGVDVHQLLEDFTTQLHEIKRALENRDFVSLNDILKYEAPTANLKWCGALTTLRSRIAA